MKAGSTTTGPAEISRLEEQLHEFPWMEWTPVTQFQQNLHHEPQEYVSDGGRSLFEVSAVYPGVEKLWTWTSTVVWTLHVKLWTQLIMAVSETKDSCLSAKSANDLCFSIYFRQIDQHFIAKYDVKVCTFHEYGTF